MFFVLRRMYKDKEELSFMGVVITAILASYMCKGVTYADYCSESGNIMILILIYMCIFQKNNGMEVPIAISKDDAEQAEEIEENAQ